MVKQFYLSYELCREKVNIQKKICKKLFFGHFDTFFSQNKPSRANQCIFLIPMIYIMSYRSKLGHFVFIHSQSSLGLGFHPWCLHFAAQLFSKIITKPWNWHFLEIDRVKRLFVPTYSMDAQKFPTEIDVRRSQYFCRSRGAWQCTCINSVTYRHNILVSYSLCIILVNPYRLEQRCISNTNWLYYSKQ